MKRHVLVLGVVAVCAMASLDAGAKVTVINSSSRVVKTAPATRGPVAEAASRDNWVATRAIVRDVQTGKLRKPTVTETRDLVKTIRQLTARPSIMRSEGATPRGGVSEAAPQQVIIARATEEGGMETICVGSFEEAATFLGLVNQPAGAQQ